MRAAIYARMSTDRDNEHSPEDPGRCAATAVIEPRRRAFADALGHLIAENVWQEIISECTAARTADAP